MAVPQFSRGQLAWGRPRGALVVRADDRQIVATSDDIDGRTAREWKAVDHRDIDAMYPRAPPIVAGMDLDDPLALLLDIAACVKHASNQTSGR